MPWSPPKHCPRGHPAFIGTRCPHCAATVRAAAEARRPSARARGYDGKWDKARAEFLAAHPTCVGCGAPATVVDHIEPHKGDQRLFWSRPNWQPMCSTCHGRKTAKHDGGFGNTNGDTRGGSRSFDPGG